MAAKRAPGRAPSGRPSSAGSTQQAADQLRVVFGANFRAARLAVGLTQQQVAEITGISRPHISEIEGGLQNLTVDTMNALARAVGLELQILLEKPARRKGR